MNPPSDVSLEGRIALVTGAARGIGAATASALAQRGAHVVLLARNAEALEQLAESIRDAGGSADTLVADLLEGEADEIVATVLERQGRLDVLVNNAGMVGPFGPTLAQEPKAWRDALTLNVFVPASLTMAAAPGMVERGFGRIVNMSSGAARSAMPNLGPYSASKAALEMHTSQLGAELGDGPVRATAVDPGPVDTDMFGSVLGAGTDGVGETVHGAFSEMRDQGQVTRPEQPGALVAAIAAADDPSLQGALVALGDERASALVAGA